MHFNTVSEWPTKDPNSRFFSNVTLEVLSHCRVLIKSENLFILLIFTMPLNYFNVMTTLTPSNIQRATHISVHLCLALFMFQLLVEFLLNIKDLNTKV